MAFNDEHFMLKNAAGKDLYQVAKEQPIYDFHCHLDPQAIFEDKPYENIVDLWLDGDHYKWRLMRANGVPENLITGDASKEDRFRVWAETVGRAWGNPLYHWTALELKNVFGISQVLTGQNWKEIYDRCNAVLVEKKIGPRYLLELSNVRFVGTTDHPLDDLTWHQKIAADDTISINVAPTFRPDEAFVEHANFAGFTKALAAKTDTEILRFADFIAAMRQRVAYFAQHGAQATDISLGTISFVEYSQENLDRILAKALQGQVLSTEEIAEWQTGIYRELCKVYHEFGLVTQIHFGAVRNAHSKLFSQLGPDSGFDSMGDQTGLAHNLNRFLDSLAKENCLPKMVLFNLNPAYNAVLANTVANFQANEEGIKSKIQFGAGWWFNDTKLGMIDQMNHYAEQGMFANFIGMLTDSRSFMSFQRHDYFRRILCSHIGQWIEDEEIPNDTEALAQLIADICYNNAETFFQHK
ncbi:glucuronate isomerase [Streptococcus gallolyticus]|nr:glucuronate isomerase [Streptococcus gallolyticus]MBY5041230.1 glucuronate isomerase [Streptococcus gallolyticus]